MDYLSADARHAKLRADLEILEKGPREEKRSDCTVGELFGEC
jgi:hypothetical protein